MSAGQSTERVPVSRTPRQTYRIYTTHRCSARVNERLNAGDNRVITGESLSGPGSPDPLSSEHHSSTDDAGRCDDYQNNLKRTKAIRV